MSTCISHQEIARLDNGEDVYGTYEEVEAYAEKQNTWVIKYCDHVNPSTIYNTFKWVGQGMSNPMSVSVPFNYREARTKSTYNARGVDLEKF